MLALRKPVASNPANCEAICISGYMEDHHLGFPSAFLAGRGVRGSLEPVHEFCSVVQGSEDQKKDEEKNQNEDEHSDTAT